MLRPTRDRWVQQLSCFGGGVYIDDLEAGEAELDFLTSTALILIASVVIIKHWWFGACPAWHPPPTIAPTEVTRGLVVESCFCAH